MSYYGLDWLAMTLSFLAVWLIGGKRRTGFIVFAGANITWLVVGVMAESAGILIGNLGFLAMNLRNYWKWSKPVKDAASNQDVPCGGTPNVANPT